MSAPSKFTVAKWAAYLLPVAKAVFLGQLDLKDGLLKDIIESGIDLLGDDAKEKLTAFLKTKPDAVRDGLDQHLIRHTGAVLGRMVRRYAEEQTMEKYRPLLFEVAEEIPAAWTKYHASEEAGIETLRGELFTQISLGVLVPDALAPQHDTVAIIAFFRWAAVEQNMLGPLMPGLIPAMAEWIVQNVSRQLLIDICQDTKEGNAAWKESMLRLSVETHGKLDRMAHNQGIIAAHAFGAHQGVKAVQQQGDLILGQLADALKANSAETRLAAYKRSLLSAFSAYQELALDNYATAEQTCPDIWDIFVHPACSKEHLRPEDMDAAQMEKPTRLPATDLLPLLAQDDHRRTVLLADPGMGKSTLIQSLIAHLASGRPLAGAPVLNGLLPVPLILRDLVPLLPQDQVEGWTWDSLITVLLEHYQREETAPLLCEAYKGHEAEFRQLTQRNDRLFFLIDGLDEIGDLVKRQKIVQCIQDGIHAVSKEARWLITSRVIGYEDARLDLIRIRIPKDDFARFIPLDNSKSEPDYLLHEKVWSVICKEWVDIVTPIDPPFTDPPWDELKSTNFFQKSIPVMFGIGRKKLVAVPDKDGLDITGQICQRLFLAPFDDKRQDDFTSKWFKKRHSTDHSRELMREVRAHHHDGVRIISRVPNLLCMMNMLKRSGKPLPDGRAALYDEIVKAYLGGIDSAYKIKPILGHTCPFETAERRNLLSLLGAHMQQQRTSAAQPTADESQKTKNKEPRTDNDSLLISVPELQTLLIPAIEAMQQAGKVKSDHTAANLLDELLHHIASRSGLLIPRSTDVSGNTVYGFTHLSFLEFFAAEWLGKEFERLQKRLARRAEALADGLELTEADLDLEFPAPQSIEHRRDDFPKLAAIPAWHESLIFLLEARKPDASTLLRWLFPALHVPKPKLGAAKQSPEIPLLPVEAVKLAIQLAHDQEISLAPATRQSWWRTLWTAYLYWPNPPWGTGKYPGWPIAPLLLGRTVNRVEVLQALIAVYPRSSLGAQPSAFPPLYLYECNSLTESDLSLLTGLTELETLRLGGCNGIERLPDLSSLRGLRTLTVPNCTGLRGAESLLSITGLVRLEALDLGGLQLVELPDISALRRLKKLDLSGCRMLESLPDLSALSRLRWLDLNGCVALKDLTELKTQLHPDCVIFGNDRMRL